jgi:hypothetical protein
LKLGGKREPFSLEIGPNSIQDNACRGALEIGGEEIAWDLKYRSHFHATLSDKGWLGFSRTPHSDAVFSGEIRFGDKVYRGDPLGVGVQGHNCGCRHRNFWTWMHACFPQPDGHFSTLESLVYEIPLGLVFRKAVLWHQGRATVFRKLQESHRDRKQMQWNFIAQSSDSTLEVTVDGADGVHRVPYTKTDCRGTFEAANNSRAKANVKLRFGRTAQMEFSTAHDAVLEMAGDYRV